MNQDLSLFVSLYPHMIHIYLAYSCIYNHTVHANKL